jgi:putative ABC transport system ATP-binding protein
MGSLSGDVLIRLERANKTYERKFWALRDTDLTIRRGDSLAVMGPSGSGKTTLLNVVGMLDKLTSGKYFYEDKEVSSFGDSRVSEFRNRRLGFVFQSFHLIPQLTVTENVETPLYYLGVPRRVRRQASLEVLEKVGLKDRATYLPAKLSGGEMQRGAIARALVTSPELLLADEPTGNLDTATGNEILELILDLHRLGMTLLLVTHDPAIGARMRRRITLQDGRIRDDTDPEEGLVPGKLPRKKKS